jgi:Tfp pilus assembly protein PilP
MNIYHFNRAAIFGTTGRSFMRKIFRITAFFIAILVVSSCSSVEKIKPKEYLFHIKSIETRSLLGLLAEIENKNFVASDELSSKRIKLNTNIVTTNGLFSQLVSHGGLSQRNYKGITVVASQCRLENKVKNLEALYSDKLLSVNFSNGISTGYIADLLAEFTAVKISFDKKIGDTAVSARINQKKTSDFLVAVAIANGIRITNNKKAIKLHANTEYKNCGRKNLTLGKNYVNRFQFGGAVGMSCLEKKGGRVDKRLCEEAESFGLSKIKLIGYIEYVHLNYERKLVLETPSNVYIVSVGNALGKNNGVITKITSKGVNLRELVKQGNTYIHKDRFINYIN